MRPRTATLPADGTVRRCCSNTFDRTTRFATPVSSSRVMNITRLPSPERGEGVIADRDYLDARTVKQDDAEDADALLAEIAATPAQSLADVVAKLSIILRRRLRTPTFANFRCRTSARPCPICGASPKQSLSRLARRRSADRLAVPAACIASSLHPGAPSSPVRSLGVGISPRPFVNDGIQGFRSTPRPPIKPLRREGCG